VPKNRKRLIINVIVKRFGVKNGIYTEGLLIEIQSIAK
jgi:hypothetical protein